MLEVAEDSAGIEQRVNLGVESAFAFVRDVMNGKAGNDCVELAQSRQGEVKIVADHSDRGIFGEAFSGAFKHGRREIDGDGFEFGMVIIARG